MQIQWEQVTRGFAQAGLSLRSTSSDASAAYLASVGGCAPQCQQMDTSFEPPSLSPHVVGALAAYNQTAGGAVSMEMALASRQRTLVAQADMQAWKLQLEASCPTRKVLLLSEAEPGGRAFLAAVPAGPKRMEPAVFTAELRHWLGVAEASSDGWCPRCDSVLDTFSLHAGFCIAGGERNQRHNALRDLLCTWADRARFHPEKEKPGLLLPQRPEETGVARRDIFAPCFSGKPTACDLAVTGFQRHAEAGRQGGAAAAAYATVKMAHLDTASICQGQSLTFVPLVAETTGAWDHAAARVLKCIARAVAAWEQAEPTALYAELLQETSVLIRSYRGRAALQRRADAAVAEASSHAASAAAVVLSSWSLPDVLDEWAGPDFLWQPCL